MADALSATFAALADPTRRAILARLTQGAATVNELAEPFSMTLPSVSRHLKVLEAAGLVVKERSAQFRPCRLEVAPLEAADDWMGQYRVFFGERFDRLDAQLKTMMAGKSATDHKPETGEEE
ncbi:DNA-binding transcriptional ArsR family regulator [Devosia sp. UYZn731]|uniref:ArsR/SmtB family transcription factor n=1 Tax=Devosia sp. UYZn731 TaxID=3156345 RepID=UPI003395D12B